MCSGDNNKTLEKVLTLWQNKNSLRKCRVKRQSDEHIMLFGRKLSRKIDPNSIEDITVTSQRMCEDYIEARLDRSGIKEFRDTTLRSQPDEYQHVIQNMGIILEMKYPKLFNKISTHLNLTYDSEIVVWDSFNKFGVQLFSSGITWARIIAFFAFTGGLALDVTRHRKSDLIGRIVYWFSSFVMKRLAKWIQGKGGWGSIVHHFNNKSEEIEEIEQDKFRGEEFLDAIRKRRLIIGGVFVIFLFCLLVFKLKT